MSNWLERNRWALFGFLAVLSVAGIVIVYKSPSPPPVELVTLTPLPPTEPALSVAEPPTPTPEPTSTPSSLRVYISGEVNQPDVYLLAIGSIIKDAILAAGGATDQADLDVVNQALELQDQQHIHIPAKSEALPTPSVVEGGISRSAPASISADAQRALNPLVIDLNTASATELDMLPGIGPAIAGRIVEYRQTVGAFKTIDDLTNVSGIGPATFEKLKDHIAVQK